MPEPKDKLDATASIAVVNGPEGDLLDWAPIDWRGLSRKYGGCGSGSSRRRRTGDLTGPPVAEVDAAVAREHVGQCARVTELNAGR